jgi:hypothetical protein
MAERPKRKDGQFPDKCGRCRIYQRPDASLERGQQEVRFASAMKRSTTPRRKPFDCRLRLGIRTADQLSLDHLLG